MLRVRSDPADVTATGSHHRLPAHVAAVVALDPRAIPIARAMRVTIALAAAGVAALARGAALIPALVLAPVLAPVPVLAMEMVTRVVMALVLLLVPQFPSVGSCFPKIRNDGVCQHGHRHFITFLI